MGEALQNVVNSQRLLLGSRLTRVLSRLCEQCIKVWPDREQLETVLQNSLETLTYSKYLYVLDANAVQITSNVSRDGLIADTFERDRSDRSYLAAAIAGEIFSLSDAYISKNARRPSLTAVHRIINQDGKLLGYLGVDFDLRELPLTREAYQEKEKWMQIKGDPAIRSGLFQQHRIESAMDRRIDEVLDLVLELIEVHGVFHAKLHFSSSRASLWLISDPLRYRLLDIEDLTDPSICLAFGTHPYPDDAAVTMAQVRETYQTMRKLRFMDENIYLRSGSLNIYNGIVGLNFSCDGSHYMPVSEFLDKKLGFWLGSAEESEEEN
jgi:hypothetical protein